MNNAEIADAIRSAANEMNALVWNAIVAHGLSVSVTVEDNRLRTLSSCIPEIVVKVNRSL